ncbi:hypothetical protein NDR87_29710 [Nocardia sp. CDC159]|uniref:Ig-like domain-containing protein n=1 Tax=Nocardia pulmonis TaxID=2951408 RepID=A0A9X2EB65_9NOCA|nr:MULTISPECIES: hypothetical protein [Nocardia]MCM6777642.1 hypothetical protein [Nocardia pulmonis]MCM6790554.1 hypothetical protein [Nocardia sp. CDC159]
MISRIGAGLLAGTVGAALVALAAPANAAVSQLSSTPNLAFGSATNYGTGCHYTLRATVTEPVGRVAFFDNGQLIGWARSGGAYALIDWIPRTEGRHILAAVQENQTPDIPAATLELSVGRGIDLLGACNVFGG